MSVLGWLMMGLAIWHFTIFLPDRFWGGIVGALVGALAGAVVVGLAIHSVDAGAFGLPSRHATHISTILFAVPGALLGIAAAYFEGVRREGVGAA